MWDIDEWHLLNRYTTASTQAVGSNSTMAGVGSTPGRMNSALHSLSQSDKAIGTDRLGLLGGAIVPTDSERDEAVQAGAVFTRFRGLNPRPDRIKTILT